jgi:tetratricopeptide (TPR) repeat protein/DNA-binding SARP family transcriptional activator
VLAVLLLDLGRTVSPEQLIDRVWGERPPASVRNALSGYLAQLRKVIVAAAEPEMQLARSSGGYVLRAPAGQLDLHRFRALTAEAAKADGDEPAARRLREALGLWRGPALAGVDSPWLRAMRQALEAERFAAVLELNDVRLRLGEHAALVSELSGQAASSLADERLAGQLMLALYRCGRQAEALGWFEQARQQLAEELGADPGPGLRALHQQILRADPSLAAPEGAGAGPAPSGATPVPGQLPPDVPGLRPVAVPRELPPDVSAFTGRSADLAELDRLLVPLANRAKAGTAVISAIAGTPGVGKTALAVHWAHQAARHFPDGQLYVNLHGYDTGQPMPAADALAGFLRSLGVPGQDIPPEADQRAARYRSLLAGKRMLVIVDNAVSPDQVRPLLPGVPACAVVVTSRDALAGLVARDGAARREIDVLPPQEAVALLRALIGTRADAEPQAVTELAAQCCRLPLALRVAAELAASRPAMPLAGLVGELVDLGTRLDLLDAGGDPGTQVRTVFSWSCRHLGTEAASAFRLAGLHPGPDLEPYAIAALTGTTVPQTRRALDMLVRAYLIQSAGPGRYGMHDLLRAYARECAVTEDDEDERRAALTRLFDHYLYTAAAAMDALLASERRRHPRIPRPASPVPPLPGPAAAREWLDSELPVLVAVTWHTAAHGWPSHATRLAAILSSYLHNGGHFSQALSVFSHALSAARLTCDRAAEATGLNDIGDVDREQGRYREAADRYRQALTLFRAAGDQTGEARTLGSTGLVETGLGHYKQAARHQQDAAAIFRDIGDRFGEARALGNLGWVRQRQGRYQEAAGYYAQSLDLSREIGDRQGEAYTLARLGVVELRLGRYQDAAGYLKQALDLFRKLRHAVGEAEILLLLGEAYVGLGGYERAAVNFEQALTMSREIGARVTEADALNGVADVLLHTGEAGKARAHYATALRLASDADAPREQARAHNGLARAYQAVGDSVQARHHWQEALTRYTVIDAPEADEIRARLAMADNGQGDTSTEERDNTASSSA